jgi:predicted DNA-binding antitoxin AbrB/MazE fold protein
MTQTIEAVYQNGMFKPLNPISEEIADGEKVKLVVETESEEVNPIMKLAENFYEGLSESDIEEIERIALDRSNFFGDRKLPIVTNNESHFNRITGLQVLNWSK